MRADRRVLPLSSLKASGLTEPGLTEPGLTLPPIRPGRNEDGPGLIDLIRTCWAEYEDCVLDVDREAPELRRLASHVTDRGGSLFVADGGAGMVTVAPGPDGAPRGTWTLGRMYVLPAYRGAGLAEALMIRAEAAVLDGGGDRILLHSDSRFHRAHAFYEKRSFLRRYPAAVLDDLASTVDLPFAKPLKGLVVEQAGAAGAYSAVRRLADILVACVANGASVSFVAPLDPGTARAFWRRTADRVAAGRVRLFVAWLDGVLAGTVTLDLDTKPNQRHRADIAKLLVDPARRRRGVAGALMARAEAEAWSLGRSLLVLDTQAGSGGERLYRNRGWTAAGGIPDYSRDAAGAGEGMTLFYKERP